MSDRDPPEIRLTTTTSRPVTHSTTTTYTIGGRRNRNRVSQASDEPHLRPTAANDDAPEPFPGLPSPSPNLQPTTSNQDYFAQPPPQYQVRSRPIGIRRLPSNSDVDQTGSQRPRSSSGLTRRRTNTGPSSQRRPPESATAGLAGLPGHYEVGAQGGMETIGEDSEAHHGRQRASTDAGEGGEGGVGRSGSTRLRRASNAASTVARSIASKLSDDPDDQRSRRNTRNYESDVVDYLDVLDPEVSTLTTLNNVQNAMFVPDIPFLNRFYNRHPTYELSRNPTRVSEQSEPDSYFQPQLTRQISRRPLPATPGPPTVPPKSDEQEQRIIERGDSRTPEPNMSTELRRTNSLTSHVEDEHYAVLPHGVTLEGWSDEDVQALDDYVRHMLHSRRNRFKRSMRGFGKYIKKPLGFFVTLYAFLITAFGLIWVLFLIGWISLGSRKDYIVHIVDSVLVALFAIMGDGLAPFRAIDTYHMIFIAHYHRLSWKLRKQKQLPKLSDHNDLPERTQNEICADAEAGVEKRSDADWEFSVLTPEQQRKLVHHQNKFSKSHSYYRPHETSTHYAFPLKLLITIVSLLDAHSVLQIMLGSFTWGWSYHTRPEWITAVILSVSITVNITAGILISQGDKRTRKKDVVMRMMRQGLTEEAMRKIEKHKREAGLEATHVKESVDVAHAVNVQQGVTEPAGDETRRGAEEVKEKLEGYKATIEGRTYEEEKVERKKRSIDLVGESSGSGSGAESFRTASKGDSRFE